MLPSQFSEVQQQQPTWLPNLGLGLGLDGPFAWSSDSGLDDGALKGWTDDVGGMDLLGFGNPHGAL